MPPRLATPPSTTRRPASRTALLLLAAGIAATGCAPDEPPPVVDTIGPAVVTPIDSAAAVRTSGWVEAAGSVLLVPAPSPSGQAQVVFPSLVETNTGELDGATVRGQLPAGTRVQLLSRSGRAGEAIVATAAEARDAPVAASDSTCTQWPTVRLAAVDASAGGASTGDEPPAGWTVGFVADLVDPVALDSLERLPGGDSARLAAAVARIASALPNDTAAQFRGLPFSVRSARRFMPAPGVVAVVAEVVRKVSQEARPLEEHILLVAERDSAAPRAAFAPVYSERTIGAEDEVVTSEVLAAVRVRASGSALVVLFRDLYEGGRYAVLERVGPRRWLLRWTSVYTGC